MEVQSMRLAIFTSALVLCFGAAQAQDSLCSSAATEKKLAGAARTSFLKKCEKDSCESQAADKKLAGAAKNSFTKKCITDKATASCDVEAMEKKLAGAAKNSFTKKCVRDSGGQA
jgi:hypothetical protein